MSEPYLPLILSWDEETEMWVTTCDVCGLSYKARTYEEIELSNAAAVTHVRECIDTLVEEYGAEDEKAANA